MKKNQLREELATLCHQQWSGCLRYMFSKMAFFLEDGQMIVPEWAVDRWIQQMNTQYKDLSSEEKDSDRAEADKIIQIVSEYVSEVTEKAS